MAIFDRSLDLGPYVPGPDDDMIVCRCEEITKGEIRRAIHEGMYTMTEIRRYLRAGMGLCQGNTCGRNVKSILGCGAGMPSGSAGGLYRPGTCPAGCGGYLWKRGV